MQSATTTGENLERRTGDLTPVLPGMGDEPPRAALEVRQTLLGHHVRLVARGLSNGLFVFGAVGGLGKSRVIRDTLIAESCDAVLINSPITGLSLYQALHRHRQGKVIWLDDCDSLYGDLKILGILRSALWGQDSERLVTYTSSQLDGVPASFVFESRIIMTANVLPMRNAALQAVLSRVDVFELSGSNEEVIDLMRTLAERGSGDLQSSVCQEVVDFIEAHAEGRQLSLRLFEPSLSKVRYATSEGLDWRPLVQSQLRGLGSKPDTSRRLESKDKDLRCLQQALDRCPDSIGDQQIYWSKMMKKSRASFFRVLARHKAAD